MNNINTKNDTISRAAAIDEIHKGIYKLFDVCDDDEESPITYKDEVMLEVNKAITERIRKLPSAQPDDFEPCEVCEGLYSGDTLYASCDWDGGIGFDYIRDVRYCPVCGRRLSDG